MLKTKMTVLTLLCAFLLFTCNEVIRVTLLFIDNAESGHEKACFSDYNNRFPVWMR